jgi:hypothetical protein
MRHFIRTRRLLPGLLAVAALAGVAGIAVPLLTGHHGHAGSLHPAPSPSPSISPSAAPSGAVTLVAGARLADGIEVGYPRPFCPARCRLIALVGTCRGRISG